MVVVGVEVGIGAGVVNDWSGGGGGWVGMAFL